MVGFGPGFEPFAEQVTSVQARNLEIADNIGYHETRTENKDVNGPLGAVARDDSGSRELGDLVGDQLHIWAGEGGVILVGYQYALATHFVAGRGFSA